MAHNAPKHLASMAALILALALVAACDSSNPASPGSTAAVNTGSGTAPGTGTSGSGGTGTLTVMLKDSPFGEASAVLVTFSGVSVHMSGGDWATLPFAPASLTRTCDLKKLQGPQDVLGTGPLAAGHYTQIRLIVASATIYQGGTPALGTSACAATDTGLLPTATGTSLVVPAPVVVPSGEIKLNREFDVPAGGATTITLDFDGEKSINETGNGKYMMKPVVSVDSVK